MKEILVPERLMVKMNVISKTSFSENKAVSSFVFCQKNKRDYVTLAAGCTLYIAGTTPSSFKIVLKMTVEDENNPWPN